MKFIGYCRRHALRIGISLMMVLLLLPLLMQMQLRTLGPLQSKQ